MSKIISKQVLTLPLEAIASSSIATTFARSRDSIARSSIHNSYAQLGTNVNIPTPSLKFCITRPFLKPNLAETWTTYKFESFLKTICQWRSLTNLSLKHIQCAQITMTSLMTRESHSSSQTICRARSRLSHLNQICCLLNSKTWCSKWAVNRIPKWWTTCTPCSSRCRDSLRGPWLPKPPVNWFLRLCLATTLCRQEVFLRTILTTRSHMIPHLTMCLCSSRTSMQPLWVRPLTTLVHREGALECRET